jgi:ribosomal subunit interface protein
MDFEVRMHQVDLVNALRAYIEKRLRFKLGRHAGQVRTLKLRLTEQDSTTGSGPKLCFLAAKLVPSGEVIVMETNRDLYTAVSHAIERFKTALQRKIERQRSRRRSRESLQDVDVML